MNGDKYPENVDDVNVVDAKNSTATNQELSLLESNRGANSVIAVSHVEALSPEDVTSGWSFGSWFKGLSFGMKFGFCSLPVILVAVAIVLVLRKSNKGKRKE